MKPPSHKPVDPTGSFRAAQYVRMSTDHQRYSIENQADAIAAYAAQRNLEIVRTYKDEGRSGLRLDSRPALKELIADVLLGRADFARILVYDVSRWGRFQDTDESAHYEFICKEAGVRVEYCAEEFQNDGSFVSGVAKHLKRAMAGEYSRELSTKVFAGQCRLIKLGFKQGGSAGYGLQRELLDETRISKGILKRGQRKHLQTDRVILKPGSAHEISVVQRIFREFAFDKKTEVDIARGLNADSVANHLGHPWTRWLIHELLINENYIGHIVFNRKSFRLGQKMTKNPPSVWVRKDDAFEAIVDPSLFRRAAQIIEQRRKGFSNEELLKRLRSLRRTKRRLSKTLIDKTAGMPCAQLYQERFGGLRNAYALIGYHPEGNFNYIEAYRRLGAVRARAVADAIAEIKNVGGVAHYNDETGILTLNAKLSVFVAAVRCTPTRAKYPRWKVAIDDSPPRDITIVVRTDESALKIVDYYMVPRTQMSQGTFGLSQSNGSELDAYRFETLAALFGLSRECFQALVANPREAFEARKRDGNFGKQKLAHSAGRQILFQTAKRNALNT